MLEEVCTIGLQAQETRKMRHRGSYGTSRFRHSEIEPQPSIDLPKFRDRVSTIPLIASPGIIDSMLPTVLHYHG